LKDRYKGGIEVIGRRARRSKQLLDNVKKNDRFRETGGGSTRSLSVENWLWKWL
jgi:hypothetical protein